MIIDDVIVIIWIIFPSVVLTVNVVLLCIMIRHTPKSFANFSIVLKFHVVVDILTIVTASFVVSRTIAIGNSIVHIAQGPCKWFSSSACYLSYGLMTMCASMSLYILLVSFIVRLLILQNRKPSKRFIVLLSMISFPVPIAIFVLFLISRSEDSTMRHILETNIPEYEVREATIFGISDIRVPSMSYALALMVVAIIPLYCLILHIRSLILKCLDDSRAFLSVKTMSMHSRFLKMLTIQCAIPPLVFTFTLVPNELEHHNVIRHSLIEAMINICACMSTLLSPIIVLFYIESYWKQLVRLVTCNVRPASPESIPFLNYTG